MPLTFDVNYLTVIVAAIVAFIVGMVWWGPLFGKSWIRLSGIKVSKDMKKGMGGKMLIAFIANLIMAYVIATLFGTLGVFNAMSGIVLVFWLWLGFVATIGVGVVLWQGRPWGLFWLNNLGWLVTMVVIATIVGVWS